MGCSDASQVYVAGGIEGQGGDPVVSAAAEGAGKPEVGARGVQAEDADVVICRAGAGGRECDVHISRSVESQAFIEAVAGRNGAGSQCAEKSGINKTGALGIQFGEKGVVVLVESGAESGGAASGRLGQEGAGRGGEVEGVGVTRNIGVARFIDGDRGARIEAETHIEAALVIAVDQFAAKPGGPDKLARRAEFGHKGIADPVGHGAEVAGWLESAGGGAQVRKVRGAGDVSVAGRVHRESFDGTAGTAVGQAGAAEIGGPEQIAGSVESEDEAGGSRGGGFGLDGVEQREVRRSGVARAEDTARGVDANGERNIVAFAAEAGGVDGSPGGVRFCHENGAGRISANRDDPGSDGIHVAGSVNCGFRERNVEFPAKVERRFGSGGGEGDRRGQQE